MRDVAVTTSTVGVLGALAACEGEQSEGVADAALSPDAGLEPDAAAPDALVA